MLTKCFSTWDVVAIVQVLRTYDPGFQKLKRRYDSSRGRSNGLNSQSSSLPDVPNGYRPDLIVSTTVKWRLFII